MDLYPTWRNLPRRLPARRATPWCAGKFAKSGSYCRLEALKVKDDVRVRLSAVLPFSEEMGPHPIDLHARREMREDPVVHSAAHLQTKGILAVIGGFGHHVKPAQYRVRPRFPFAGAPGDLRAGAGADVFHVLVLINRRREASVDAALHSKPLVCEIGDGSVRPYSRCIVKRGAKSQYRNAQRERPAKLIAAAVHKSWLGRRRNTFGRSCQRSRLRER